MTYILTITAKRKNGKRHIVTKNTDINYLRWLGIYNINKKYIVEIYNGNWQLVERVK